MTAFLSEFGDRIEEIRSNLAFVSAAHRLRPKLNDVLNWGVQDHDLDIARSFIDKRLASPDAAIASLFILAISAFERYVRKSVESAIDHRNKCSSFDDVPLGIRTKNVLFTGRALAGSESPRDYLSFDYAALVDNLATCKSGASPFRLNPLVFSATLQSVRSEAVLECLQRAEVKVTKDDLGRSKRLQALLGTSGVRDTAKNVVEELDRLVRTRNILAHGGDGFRAFSEQELERGLEFLLGVVAAIDEVVGQTLKPSKKK